MQVTVDNLKSMCEKLNIASSVPDDSHEMFLFGIRGSRADQYLVEADALEITQRNLEPDKWRCTIIQMYKDKIMAFQATTLPGKYYTVNPFVPQGAARLIYGKWSFKRGLHQGKYPALVQNGNMIILRDTDKDFNMDYNSDYLQCGGFGINNHAGGGTDSIGKWSAGCQVIRGEFISGASKSWDSRQWTTYKSRAYSSTNKVYQYVLIPFEWMSKMVDDGSEYCFHGSSGDRVKAIQQKLGIQKVDGQYGEFTVREVMKFQKANSLQAVGVVGPQTAEKMGI